MQEKFDLVEWPRIDDRLSVDGQRTPKNASVNIVEEFFNRIDPKQTFTLPIPGPSRRQEVPLVRVGVIGGLESVVDITCQPRRAVLLFESLL